MGRFVMVVNSDNGHLGHVGQIVYDTPHPQSPEYRYKLGSTSRRKTSQQDRMIRLQPYEIPRPVSISHNTPAGVLDQFEPEWWILATQTISNMKGQQLCFHSKYVYSHPYSLTSTRGLITRHMHVHTAPRRAMSTAISRH